MKALHIAATGMSAQQMKVDVVSNNLANMSTTGYNARRADFADLHYQQLARPGTVSAADGTMLPFDWKDDSVEKRLNGIAMTRCDKFAADLH